MVYDQMNKNKDDRQTQPRSCWQKDKILLKFINSRQHTMNAVKTGFDESGNNIFVSG